MVEGRTHPIEVVQPFLEKNTAAKSVELAIYQYIPRQRDTTRTIYTIPTKEITPSFEELKHNLNPIQDIAFQSRIHMEDQEEPVKHMPLIDFADTSERRAVLFSGRVLRNFSLNEGYVVNSGKSFHLYIMDLIDKQDWIKFMGHILLTNPLKRPHLVDVRWVGHRLMDFYSALRWTNNAKNYENAPYVVKRITQ